EKYSEAFLGKPNPEYCNWILDPEKWGGAIEHSILADYYGREIAAYDIQTTRCNLYGQEGNYSERVMLIYDGLHYDALAMSPVEVAPRILIRPYLRYKKTEALDLSRRLL
ncbi:ubiquitin thioesterase OTU1-like protein, partial [Trifolium pratense]